MPPEHRRRAPLTRSRVRRTAAPPHARYRVAAAGAIGPGESLKFMLPIRGTDEECFLINFNGEYHAYLNRCRHVPMAMDWVENQFFAGEGRYLMCQTHNACYEPATGECVAGPAAACGKFLYRVPIEIVKGTIYARSPEQEFED
ncbi:MAG TPA: Rieske 2Fe-2S domain-containing protein [Candidatus Binataceae bacterium]|nr:Rieske 2Fe-2S domain-containing protein [Candidatus Binataceae bacterium]